METQTRFDLNAAIENWRAELAAQSDLTTEVRRELETHLRDSVAELRQRGLSEEEAFWVARKRVGKPGQLGEEFIKADPAAVWGERVFWMALAVLLVWLWNGTVNILAAILTTLTLSVINNSPGSAWAGFLSTTWILHAITVLMRVIPVCWFALFLAKGRLTTQLAFLAFFRSRMRMGTVCGVWGLINCSFMTWSNYVATRHLHSTGVTRAAFSILEGVFNNLSFPIALIVLLVWLMPAHFKKEPKTA